MSRPPDVQRQAVRAFLLTPEEMVLLMRIHAPQGGPSFWIAPGGGLLPREETEEGLRRELGEELGLTDFVVGPTICKREHTFDWDDKRICQREEFVVVRSEQFTPTMTDEKEAEDLDEFRWWPIRALHEAKHRIAPATMQRILLDFLQHGPPAHPLSVEVLVD